MGTGPLQEWHQVMEEDVVRIGTGRVIVRVGTLAVDQRQIGRNVGLPSQDGGLEETSSTQARPKGVDQEVLGQGVAHGGVDAEHLLGGIGVPVRHRPRVVGQPLREVPLGTVDVVIGYPENIVAKRSMGVRAPVPLQPWIGPDAEIPDPGVLVPLTSSTATSPH